MHELEGRSPVIVMEVPATGGGDPDDTVLLYGHLDKQPEMTGWRDGLGPWLPVREGDRLYGRGGADDGYAAFASLGAIEAVHAAGGAHARCIVLIEASEESGSPDLPAHIEALADRLGTPSLVVCLDSGCLDYERLWVTTSLRGLAGGKLKVEILGNGVHSGDASGVVPDTFRIVRHLLDRVEDAASGEVLLADLHVAIPDDRRREAAATAADLAAVSTKFPWVDGARPAVDDPTEQLLARTWRPALTVTGADGLPATAVAGNVLRPSTTLQLSMRLPPTCDPDGATELLRTTLTTDPPYGARVVVRAGHPWPRLERPGVLAVAVGLARAGVAGQLRLAGPHLRRGRVHPVHGHAGRTVPRSPVRDHRRARPGQQRPRPRRVPPPAHRRAADRRAWPPSSTTTPTGTAELHPRSSTMPRRTARSSSPGRARPGSPPAR